MHCPLGAIVGLALALVTGPLPLLAAGLTTAGEPEKAVSPELGRRPIAELGDLKVPAATVWRIEKAWLAGLKRSNPQYEFPAAERPNLRRDIALKELELALIEKLALERKVSVAKEELEAKLNESKERILRQGGTYEEFLAGMAKTDDDFRRLTSSTLALHKSFLPDISDAQVKEAFDKYADQLPLRRCAHVLYSYKGAQVSSSSRSKEEARQLAEKVRAEVRSDPNFDFAKLARDTSDCPSKNEGGDLNFSPRRGEGQMVPAFADALYGIGKVGDYSNVVETDFGFHVIKLTAVREFKDLAGHIRFMLAQEKMNKLLQQELGEKNANAKFAEDLLALPPPD